MAPPPPHDTIVAALQALRVDAQCWRNDAAQLRRGSRAAVALDLDSSAFSGLAEAIGYAEVYHRLVVKVADLFDGGAANLDAVAVALTTAADAYDQDERMAVHQMKGMW